MTKQTYTESGPAGFRYVMQVRYILKVTFPFQWQKYKMFLLVFFVYN